ncbi:AlpA family transcriptional regulator [Massilia sp. Leaf139]|uniref:helix-turn-helix transcriptional regulator n=1 Tax=Massilia sp. Leaf139 TaxID=1736272 RepID=UPI0009EA9B64|nr:AlpA family phage regulatory protein [Massilia sp. Leaf139]
MSTTARNPVTLHETGYVRQSQLVGKKGAPGIIPFSPATLWRKVAAGQFPAPVKLSAGVTAWRVEDVRAWLDTPR